MQAYIAGVSAKNGHVGIGVGYVDAHGADFGLGVGRRSVPGSASPFTDHDRNESFTAEDTVVLGSGTKPYVAAAVMRLVDAGKVALGDKALVHLDPVMLRLWNTTFVQLLGAPAANVTVEHLVRMQSGLADMDVAAYEDWVLLNESARQPPQPLDPLSDLKYVAGLNAGSGGPSAICPKCTWVFSPGQHSMYTSTNFLLAGLVVLAHAGATDTWETFGLSALLDAGGAVGFSASFPRTFFPTTGALDHAGLSTAGSCSTVAKGSRNATTVVYRQDASIMGFCYGNTIGSAWDTARFYYRLLGTDAVVSRGSRAVMQRVREIDVGWGRGIPYGVGLELECATAVPAYAKRTRHYGHAGTTFGFQSIIGFYPDLNVSLSVTLNSDHAFNKRVVICRLVEMILVRQGAPVDIDLKCDSVTGQMGCNFNETTPLGHRAQPSHNPT